MIQEGDPSTPISIVLESDTLVLIPEVQKDGLFAPVKQGDNPLILWHPLQVVWSLPLIGVDSRDVFFLIMCLLRSMYRPAIWSYHAQLLMKAPRLVLCPQLHAKIWVLCHLCLLLRICWLLKEEQVNH